MLLSDGFIRGNYKVRTTVKTINDEEEKLETESNEGKVSDPFHAGSHLCSFDEESREEEEKEENGRGDDQGRLEVLGSRSR